MRETDNCTISGRAEIMGVTQYQNLLLLRNNNLLNGELSSGLEIATDTVAFAT